MAKKRKKVEIIGEIDYSVVKSEEDRPKCFNSKKPYCQKDLCEEYYDSCRSSEEEEGFK